MATKHDLIFFEKRSTPKVVSQGKSFTAPESYGKQTKRIAATPEQEKQIASGQWIRVDQSGKKGGQPGYKKTKMKGREHLVKHALEKEVTIVPKAFEIADNILSHLENNKKVSTKINQGKNKIKSMDSHKNKKVNVLEKQKIEKGKTAVNSANSKK